ncbi:nuclear transport factor 2 family protein [Streptomyces sp. NPDC093085]|uniref:nuclear transport factor 2 family protein n=1 Tax=Streptomyces sp. NPDC093085 TaxID=3155068 RepID=UPI003444DB8D
MSGSGVSADLYVRVRQFYARQMQALDGGRYDAYAASFTEDGTFVYSPDAEPAVGREVIHEELVRFHERFESDPMRQRHWFDHIVLEPADDGSLTATFYALVVNVRPGGTPEFVTSALVHDVLVEEEDGATRMRYRRIDSDSVF